MNTESTYARKKKNKERRLWWASQELSHAQLITQLHDPDPMKRTATARRLRYRNSKAVSRDCMGLCHSAAPAVREQAVWILGRLTFPGTAEGKGTEQKALALLHALAEGDPRARVRAEAESALEYRSTNRGDLKETETKVESTYARRKINKEDQLRWDLRKLPHKKLIEHLGDVDPWKRTAAIQELHTRNSRAATKDAIRLCYSPNPKVREDAALVLGQLVFSDDDAGRDIGTKVVNLLCALALSDPRALVRAGAVCALGHRALLGGDPEIILKAADSGSRDRAAIVRYHTAFALGRLNIPGAEIALLRLLRDKDKDVRDWAAFALFMQEEAERLVYDTPEIRDALLELANDADETVRFEALRSLGILKEKRAAPLLMRELDNDDVVHFDLVKAAGRIGDPALIPVLEKVLERFGDDEDIIKTVLDQLRKK